PALSSGPWDEAAAWLGVGVQVKSQERAEPGSAVFPDGGYVVLRNSKGVIVMIRTPKANFRPPHADALHIDLWSRGHNLLKDGGTYTYADDDVASALASVSGHNTLQFDDHDQMPRLGRFLYGQWIRVTETHPSFAIAEKGQTWAGAYTD